MEQLVQPIVVTKNSSHWATVEAAARASLGVAFASEEAAQRALKKWLSGPFTKTVRRATPAQLESLREWAAGEGIASASVGVRDSQALALQPLAYDAFPKQLRKLQVSGTDFPREEGGPGAATGGGLTLALLGELTTGKAAAQAAHAYWKWFLMETPEKRLEVDWSSQPLELLSCSAGELAHWAQLGYPIQDNGLTEVDPQTLTAVALPVGASQ